MDSTQIKCFIAAAETLHFSRAADKLGMGQSVLSRQIMSLESEVGCRLFDRANKWRLSLTDAGRAFLPNAEKIADVESAAKLGAKKAAKGECGSLSMEVIPSFFTSEKFFASLKQMRADYPEVFLKLGKHSSASILAKVEKGELDFGIIRVSQRKTLDVKSIELGREKILLALPASHRLAKKSGAVEMSELKNEKFAMLPYEESPFFRRTIDEALRRGGILTPNVAEEIYNFDAVLRLLPHSDIITFVPALMKPLDYADVVYKTLRGLDEPVVYAGIWKADNHSKTLGNFVSILKKSFRI